jgi:large subunit ribosomal protein L10
MARPDKAAAVAELTEAFRESSAAVLTEYRGLTVSQLQELRRALGDDARYTVVKNTLTRIAARDAGFESLEPMLQGPSAIVFVTGDPVNVAKGIRDFARAHPLLVVKGGVLDGRPVDPSEISRLAELESREVLLARVAGGLTASLSRAAALFQAPIAQAARLAEALRQKAEADPSVLAAPAQTTSNDRSSDLASDLASDPASDPAEAAGTDSTPAGTASTGSAGTDREDTDPAGTGTPVMDTPVTDTPVTDTPVTDTPVTDTTGTEPATADTEAAAAASPPAPAGVAATDEAATDEPATDEPAETTAPSDTDSA